MSENNKSFDESEGRDRKLLRRAARMDDTPARVALLEEAVREADARNDLDAAFEARLEYIRASTFAGFPEKALVAFSWCLAQVDADPERFEVDRILWQYKWILGSLPNFPQITPDQMVRMQDDLESRLIAHGYSRRIAHFYRYSNCRRMGWFEPARRHFEAWQAMERDGMSNCPACERDDMVTHYLDTCDDERALAAAAAILNGELSCASVPQTTLAEVLQPLVRLGRMEEAAQCHQRGYAMIAGRRNFVGDIAAHMLYLAHLGDHNKAMRILQDNLHLAMETNDLDDRFKFYSAAASVLAALADRGAGPRKLSLPADHPLASVEPIAPRVAADWFIGETAELAARFNERNGNDHFTRLMEQDRAWARG